MRENFRGMLHRTDTKNLQDLDLSFIGISGFIVSEIRLLKNLSYLFLDSNHINGSILLEIGNMKSLIELNLSNNKIVGQNPSTLANRSLLNSLSLKHNYLTRTVPSGIRDSSLLIYVNLNYNNLTSNIPLFLINISQFNLSYNFLEGRILKSQIFSKIMYSNNFLAIRIYVVISKVLLIALQPLKPCSK